MSKLVDLVAKIDFDLLEKQIYTVKEEPRAYTDFDTKEHAGYIITVVCNDEKSPLFLQDFNVKYKKEEAPNIKFGNKVKLHFVEDESNLYAQKKGNFATVAVSFTVDAVQHVSGGVDE